MRDVTVAAGTEIRRLLRAACASYGARVALVITDAGDLIDGVQHRDDGALHDLSTSGAIASGLYAAGNQLAALLGDPDVGSVLQQDDGAQHLLLRLEPGVALVLEVPSHQPLPTLRHDGRQLATAIRAALLLTDTPAAPVVAPRPSATASGSAESPRRAPVVRIGANGLVTIASEDAAPGAPSAPSAPATVETPARAAQPPVVLGLPGTGPTHAADLPGWLTDTPPAATPVAPDASDAPAIPAPDAPARIENASDSALDRLFGL